MSDLLGAITDLFDGAVAGWMALIMLPLGFLLCYMLVLLVLGVVLLAVQQAWFGICWVWRKAQRGWSR